MADVNMKGQGRPRGWNGSGNSPAKKKIMLGKDSLGKTHAAADLSTPATRAVPGAAAGQSSNEATVSNEAPEWFKRFEERQEARFHEVLNECREAHACFRFDIDNMKDEIDKVTQALKQAEIKINELENRGRRNNIVLFNIPEDMEGSDCAAFVKGLLAEATSDPVVLRSADEIQRAHRTGKKSSATTPSRGQKARPRPIHVGYSSYIAKEKSKKSLRELFKSKKFGPNDTSFFASDDYSRKVQQLRKEKIPELKRLRKEGKRAYLAYPAEIRIQDSGPESNMDQSQS